MKTWRCTATSSVSMTFFETSPLVRRVSAAPSTTNHRAAFASRDVLSAHPCWCNWRH